MSHDVPAPRAAARWKGPALFVAFVASVVGAAYAAAARHRALHGADFVTGVYLDARFTPPAGRPGGTERVHQVAWPLAPGSGSLRVRFEARSYPAAGPRARERVVTAVRVEPGPDVLDGVEASVRVTGYDTVTVGADGAPAPVGRVTLECLERAADGEHAHRIELRADGSWADPDPG